MKEHYDIGRPAYFGGASSGSNGGSGAKGKELDIVE